DMAPPPPGRLGPPRQSRGAPRFGGTELAMARGVKTRTRAPKAPAIVTDPVASARQAGLRYVGETGTGIHRRRAGRGFVYLDGHVPVRDGTTRARFRALVFPPAWREAWLRSSPLGVIQSTVRN